MSKHNMNNRPQQATARQQPPTEQPPKVEPKVITITLQIPVMDYDPVKYATPRIDMNLRPKEMAGYQKIYRGLHESGARMSSGAYINNPPDALRWLMEQIGQQSK